MPTANRGEVWVADLGYVAKTRPCLVLSVPFGSADRAAVTSVAHTTSVSGLKLVGVLTGNTTTSEHPNSRERNQFTNAPPGQARKGFSTPTDELIGV
jgi:hypothetical protein